MTGHLVQYLCQSQVVYNGDFNRAVQDGLYPSIERFYPLIRGSPLL